MNEVHQYVQGLVSSHVLVRLDNGATARGLTISIDDRCNILLVDCIYTFGTQKNLLSEMLIRSNHILFITADPYSRQEEQGPATM
ncbi:Putative RNA-binding protein, LSm family protein [Giardia duodenalis]|uniref:SnRNP Sm-like protein, putative n=2 Tax=Giardia intestinalis TaxID=5741 RepID=C6LYF8_GIAIB|nr:SnRNP Sm-like protein, putative [Giardia intestinalis ATCC 50581]ESU42178.1 Putative RNA-binding protein, LSm family protein [Giardia intestinalis]